MMQTSEHVETILPALHRAKQAFQPALKTAVNPHFRSKYVDLASVIDATEEALSKEGLLLLQGVEGDIQHAAVSVTTRLFHVSGEWIETSLTLPAGGPQRYDAQTVGSAITYGRRYSYMAILGIAPEDDDGSTAAGKHNTAPDLPQNLSRKMDAQALSFAKQPPPESLLTRQLRGSIEAVKQMKAVPDDDPGITDDDLPSEMFDQREPEFKVRPASPPYITEPQAKRFHALALKAGKTKSEVQEALRLIGAQSSLQIPRSRYEALCEWAEARA
jgi:hypothetical protein